MPQYDDWYEKICSTRGLLLELSDRFDREDFLTCFPSKWQYWCDAYRFRDENYQNATYHFRQADNWYVAEVRYVAERTSKFGGE